MPYYIEKREEWAGLPCPAEMEGKCETTHCTECFARWLDADNPKCEDGKCIVGMLRTFFPVTENEITKNGSVLPGEVAYNNYCPQCRRPIDHGRIEAMLRGRV
ncbi:MAG: hypothetical protein K8R90_05310 [Candidatus Cloacimonetes bacterium]|nr:hypothetical protein [Candidatus Cloacimonadota bacterium]